MIAVQGQAAPRRMSDPSEKLLDLDPRRLWRSFSRESVAFWGLCFYLFIEYVRPQSAYRSLDVLPWGQVALAIPVIAILFERPRKRPFLFLDGALLLYIVVLGASLVGAYDLSASMEEIKTFINWILLYYLATRILTTPPRFLIFFLSFMLWSLKMSQFGARAFVLGGFQFHTWGISGGPGWFQNSGEMAVQMCVFLAVSIHFILGLRHRWPKWKTWFLLALLPGTAFLAVIMSSSRGGQIGAAAVLIFVVAQSKHRVRGLVTAALLLPALWLITPAQEKARFTTMGHDETSTRRLQYWKDGIKIMEEHPILGIGYNNWIPYYHRYYDPTGEVPHNIFVEAGSELGYFGIVALVMLIVGTFYTNWKTRRLSRNLGEWGLYFRCMAFGFDAALVGFMVPGFFVTVLYYPEMWTNLAMTASLHLLALRASQGRRQVAGSAGRRLRRRAVWAPQPVAR